MFFWSPCFRPLRQGGQKQHPLILKIIRWDIVRIAVRRGHISGCSMRHNVRILQYSVTGSVTIIWSFCFLSGNFQNSWNSLGMQCLCPERKYFAVVSLHWPLWQTDRDVTLVQLFFLRLWLEKSEILLFSGLFRTCRSPFFRSRNFHFHGDL